MSMENLVVEKKSHKLRNAVIWIVVLLAVGAVVAATVLSRSEPVIEEVQQDIVVGTVSPAAGGISVMSEYIGTMEPLRQVTVYPKAAGEVLSVHFKVGDAVKAGDILFELDSTPLETSIAQTQAAIASAQAKANKSLAITENSLATYEYNLQYGFDATMKAAQNAVDQAQTGLDNAKIAEDIARNRVDTAEIALRSARRTLEDFEDGIYPPSMVSLEAINYDEDVIEDSLRDAVRQARESVAAAQLGVDQAGIAVAAAEEGLRKAQEGVKTAEIMAEEQRISMRAQIEMGRLNTNFSDQQIAIQKLQDDLGDYKVIAPIDGVVERRGVEPLDMAAQQTPAFVISDKNSMTVTFRIPKASYGHIKTGDGVTLENVGETFAGRVTEISTMVDASGLFTVEAEISNPPQDLYTGAAVKIHAQSRKVENAMLIPLSALWYDNGVPYVYIAENGFAKRALVETGIYDSDNVQIISGLNYTDSIISTWSSRLADGVEIVLAGESEAK